MLRFPCFFRPGYNPSFRVCYHGVPPGKDPQRIDGFQPLPHPDRLRFRTFNTSGNGSCQSRFRQLQTRPGLEKVQSRQTVEKMTLSRQLEEDGGLLVNDVGEDSALDVEFSFRIRTKELDRLAGENFLDEGFKVKASGTTCRDFKMTLTVNG